MEEKFYTIDQVAEMLGMHHKTIRKFIIEGKLTAGKLGKQWRISGHDLSLFLEKNGQKGTMFAAEPQVEEGSSLHEEVVGYCVKSENQASYGNRINVSTVVDISSTDLEDFSRISGMLLAVMNSGEPSMKGCTINMMHNREENRLRIMLWGNISFINGMLETISTLTESEKR